MFEGGLDVNRITVHGTPDGVRDFCAFLTYKHGTPPG